MNKKKVNTSELVSVIIPTYNRAGTIQRAIQSVIKQTYQNLEIIVIDDGSTDNTSVCVQKIEDPRLIYVVQENQGSQAARNHGIRLAQGTYIGFLDSDDEWLPQKVECNLITISEHKADIIFSQFLRIHLGYPDEVIPNDLETGFVIPSVMADTCRATTDTIFGYTDAIKSIMFDERVKKLQDYDFMVSAAKAGKKIFFDQEILVRQYHSDVSITTMVQARKLMENTEYLLQKHHDMPTAKLMLKRTQREALMDAGENVVKVSQEIYQLSRGVKDWLYLVLASLHIIRPAVGLVRNIRSFKQSIVRDM